ncbi:MAG: N-acetyltransferase [Dehalococcoidales bacterium]|nr:N-acetyltransferase [Dehalococcoidales bacterium]MDP6738326.1 N-acetyltransferase [Dehalococcoidales bacterium]
MAQIEKAKISDVPQMHQLINSFAERGDLLARPLSELYENIRDFFVVHEEGRVTACAALHINWSNLGEIKSVVVAEDHQRQGVGNRLIKACLKEAKELGISTIFCLTYKPNFFTTLGFSQVDRMTLSHKIWGECYRCPKFPNCDEVALIYHLETEAQLG